MRVMRWLRWLKRWWCHPLTARRYAPDYPKDRAEALEVMMEWPADGLTEKHLIAAQQLLRTPPGAEGVS